MQEVIRAAGGIVTRQVGDVLEVLLVRRGRHEEGEWTLPKGKFDLTKDVHVAKDGTRIDDLSATAKREVEEETGRTVVLGAYVGALGYLDHGVPKVVLYWRMTATKEGKPTDASEVEEAKWMSVFEALRRLRHANERRFLATVFEVELMAVDGELLPLPSPPARGGYCYGWEWLYWVLGIERANSRLLAGFQASRNELRYLASRKVALPRTWIEPALSLLNDVRDHLVRQDFDAGWRCLRAADRHMIGGLRGEEIAARADTLRAEVGTKHQGWRASAVASLLSGLPNPSDPPACPYVTSARLIEATAIRDEADANNYAKIALMGDQLVVLVGLAGVSIALIVLIFAFCAPCSSLVFRCDFGWHPSMLVMIVLFGVLGASLSTAHKIMSAGIAARIPDSVANKWVTFARVAMGGVSALTGHVVIQAGIVNVPVSKDELASRLALAIVFGFTGERLIAPLLDAVKPK